MHGQGVAEQSAQVPDLQLQIDPVEQKTREFLPQKNVGRNENTNTRTLQTTCQVHSLYTFVI